MSALTSASRRIRLGRRWAQISRRLGRPRISRKRVRLLTAIGAILALVAVGGWLLFRDSSFVRVEHVSVTGVEGSDAGAVTAALDSAAHKMTTLDVGTSQLRAAVSGFREVKGLRVTTSFPHGIVIHVIELVPVAVVQTPGRSVVIAGDGTLLPSVRVTASLPVITLSEPPIGNRLDQAWARAAVTLLAAAPSRLLPKLAEATTVAGHGLVVQIRNGPSVYFGDATQAQAKWSALVAVLANPGSAGASYIDVTDPGRPAAGTDAQVALPSSSSTTAGTTGGSSTSTGTTTSTTSTTSAAVSTGTLAVSPTTSSAGTSSVSPSTSSTGTSTGG